MMDKRPLIILAGPTASGKTGISVRLAEKAGGEIISADSMQVYKEMTIGTAKILPDEMNGINHYLVDEIAPDEPFNVVIFQQMAKKAMEKIYDSGHIPLLVGGTGFYIQAVLYDIDFEDNAEDDEYRIRLQEAASQGRGSDLYEKLKDIDPDAAKAIHPNNIKKIIRALEYHEQTGRRISEHNEEQRKKESPYNYVYFVLDMPRANLYERIEKRVDSMMAAGLLEEVRRLKSRGYDRSLVSMQGLGYKELFAYLDGEMTLDEAVEIIKRDTRRFAKRQMTWFRREKDVIYLDRSLYKDEEGLLSEMISILKERKIIG